MNKSNIIEREGRAGNTGPLTELLCNGARQLLQQAIEEELQELLVRTQTGCWKIALAIPERCLHWRDGCCA